ncbi:O-antigen ligase family protein [Cupriavidus numazuensis]|uniref:O-antigen ligase-related domain-containing protein n=1 Tax=Cupriavidus numazuensis TaxID=221992 RepID=A0ABM8TBM1_9BURK|nr:O-antigen ligase [Cupriavidus numazuensis]CAG2133875.1 hypothetical protein LMG26411_00884 [Cupriavidus numazuensis]
MFAYTSFATFIFFAISLVIPGGFSVGPVLLLLGSFVLMRAQRRVNLATPDYVVIAALAIYFFSSCLMNVFQVSPGREYDAPLRFLLAIPAIFLLLEYPPTPIAIWGGLATGAIGSGIFSAWQTLVLLHERAEGFTNPIQYGNISLLLGTLCLAGIDWARNQRHATAWMTALVTGAVCGILGSLFTGSRGSWLALPFCLAVLMFQYRRVWKAWHFAVGLIAVLVAVMFYQAAPHNSVKKRIELAFTESSAYSKEHNARTSVGARLEMWRTGILLIKERPALGWGKQGYMNDVQRLIHEGKVDAVVGEHSHLHNEYLDAWVKRGILGLFAVLILYLAPLYLFAVRTRHVTEQAKPYAVAGIMLSLSYLIFGLTQAFLTHVNGVMLYAFTLAILWTATTTPVQLTIKREI